MPGGDGSGPMGMGPMTGRAAGFCAGYPTPGFANPAPRRGFWGWGRGGGGGGRGRGGWGRRNGFYATGQTGWQRAGFGYPPGAYAPPVPAAPDDEQHLDAMKAQAEYLEDALADVRKRIDELQSASKQG